MDDAEESNWAIAEDTELWEKVTNEIEEGNKGKGHSICMVLIIKGKEIFLTPPRRRNTHPSHLKVFREVLP
jgi:hypothetical protein